MSLRSCRHALLALSLLLLAGCPLPGVDADAGPDQVVDEGASVTLQGSAPHPEYIVGYRWTQTAGPRVKFKVSKKGALTFTAPGTELPLALKFKLVVQYQRGFESQPDTVDVTVNQIKFFGTATAAAADYESFLNWFDQVTPENAGKWGSVEATRDVISRRRAATRCVVPSGSGGEGPAPLCRRSAGGVSSRTALMRSPPSGRWASRSTRHADRPAPRG